MSPSSRLDFPLRSTHQSSQVLLKSIWSGHKNSILVPANYKFKDNYKYKDKYKYKDRDKYKDRERSQELHPCSCKYNYKYKDKDR